MSYNFCLKKILVILLFFFIASCKGFYEPVTLDVEIPDGPAEYKSGWRAGCRSGLAASRANFANSFVYNVDFGTGIYTHDSLFARGWGNGWFACVIHASTFVQMPSMQFGPLQK